MIRAMRRLLLLTVLAAGLAIPVVAFGQDSPSPAAVSACQAEAAKLGNDAFVAKYGPTEPWGHCYALHSTTTTTTTSSDDPATICKAEYLQLGADAFAKKYGTPETYGNCLAAHGARPATTTTTTTTTTTQTTPDDPATAACKAEYLQLGPAAFAAKYGAKETFDTCVAQHKQPSKPNTDGQTRSVANALCQAAAKQLGKDGFVAKYGKEGMSACIGSLLAKARAIVVSCQAKATSGDAFKACLAGAVGASQKR